MIFLSNLKNSFIREVKWLKRNPWDLSMITWIPLLACLFIWWIFSPKIPHDLPIGMLDLDRTSVTQQLSRYIESSPGVTIKERYTNILEAESALDSGRVYAVLVVPKESTAKLKTGKSTQLILNTNAQFLTQTGLIEKDLRTVIGTMSAGVKILTREKKGESKRVAYDTFSPLQVVMVPLFNTNTDYQQFLATTLIPALLHMMAMVAGACAVGRELRNKTLGSWLYFGFKKSKEFPYALFFGSLLGKLIPYMLSFTFLGMIFVLVFYGSLFSSYLSFLINGLIMYLFIIFSILMGSFFSLILLSMRLGLTATGVITAPAFAFSGIGFPIFSMPLLASIWAQLLPLTHYLSAQVSLLEVNAPYYHGIPTFLYLLVGVYVNFVVNSFLLARAYKKPEKWGRR